MSLPTPWRTFTFRQVDGLDLQLDFYPGSSQPSGTFSSSARSPFLFLVHGGGYTAGNRQTWPPWIFALARSRGWAFVSADYRLVPEAGAVEIVEDVKSAWEFVVGGELNEVLGGDMKVDTSRGVVMGVSAGE